MVLTMSGDLLNNPRAHQKLVGKLIYQTTTRPEKHLCSHCGKPVHALRCLDMVGIQHGHSKAMDFTHKK